MAESRIRFDDGAAYENAMGKWSHLAAQVFLDWLRPASGLQWIDVGCGNGAFTEDLVERCAPASVIGVDPAEGQLAYARTRAASRIAEFRQGDAMSLPFRDRSFDAAVISLAIYFVPDPARGVAEMVRVVRPGGSVSAYAWDMQGYGFPFEPFQLEMRALGYQPPQPPSAEASRMDAMRTLWNGAGLEQVQTREIVVERTYASFGELWTTSLAGAASLKQTLEVMKSPDIETLRNRLRDRLPSDSAGRITYSARANAIKGSVPGRG